MKGRCIYEGRKKSWNVWRNWKADAFQKARKSLEFFIADINKFRDFLKEKSERNVWESVLAKIPGFFESIARFYNSKEKRRCAGCRFVTDAVGAQISIKKSRNFMRNGWGKPPMEIPHTTFAIRRYRFYGIIFFSFIIIILFFLLPIINIIWLLIINIILFFIISILYTILILIRIPTYPPLSSFLCNFNPITIVLILSFQFHILLLSSQRDKLTTAFNL